MKKRIGILGDGQLARMLAEAAQNLNLDCAVLVRHALAPAARVGVKNVVGQSGNLEDLKRFFKEVDVVTFENEFADCALLRQAQQAVAVEFKPEIKIIELLQNKLGQKSVLEKLGIPHPTFWVCDTPKDLSSWLREVRGRFGEQFVLKWATLGYDGKGVLLVKPDTTDDVITKFCAEAIRQNISIFAEEFISFHQELAITASFSKTSGAAFYPLVISFQKNGVCDRVKGPAIDLGVEKIFEQKASQWIHRLADALSYEGTLAIEFFSTADGRLLVNEIAPRVHNTAHYSQDACVTSQFENHLRAISGMPLGDCQANGFFAMLNILGPEGVRLDVKDFSFLPEAGRNFRCHWYEKQEIVAGRKLGHLNACVESETELTRVIQAMEQWESLWIKNVRALK